jgi:hypothetical protein
VSCELPLKRSKASFPFPIATHPKAHLSSKINLFNLFYSDQIILSTLNIAMHITQGQGSSRGPWSPVMVRTFEGTPQQPLNHTARQISGQHDQEVMARERQMMFLQNSLHAYPGWRPSVQAPPPESSDRFTESLDSFGDNRSFLHPEMYFEARGPGRDDQLLAAMGHTPHHQVSQHLPTPESFPRQVEIHYFAKVGWLTVYCL